MVGPQIPPVALEWFILHALTSDVEMAYFSNTCTSWRSLLIQTIYKMACDKTGDFRLDCQPLLLTSFARKLALENEENQAQKGEQSEESLETFCLAWFSPEGIRTTWVSQDDDSEVDDYEGEYGAEFLSLGARSAQNYLFDDKSNNSFSERGRGITSDFSTSRSRNAEAALVAAEWRGFQSPVDVFRHFGYTSDFLRCLIATLPFSKQRDALLMEEFPANTTNAAVRGATIARAEGYCLCYEDENDNSDNEQERDNEKQGLFDIMQMGAPRPRSERRRARKRQQLRRATLPRVLVAQSEEKADTKPTPPISVQFLNGSRDHAVCMVTPLFRCGPQKTPITLFCVAIATEDGCFLSGLHHRFEVGHLYPATEMFEITEQSPICIATESWNQSTESVIVQTDDSDEQQHGSDFRRQQQEMDDFRRQESVYSSDYSTTNRSESTAFCNCIFHGVGEKSAQLDTEPECIARGSLGPGSWHVYSIIVDGDKYRIRVDGNEEPVTKTIPSEMDHFAMLDGITLGSDHNFGVSLCCGQGSPGGQGAIAEVAAFRGVLSVQDIERLERRLMKKHNIPTPAPNFRERNENETRAHFLYCQGIGGTADGSVPLKFLAQHKSVAWKQYDNVSGNIHKISKIGARRSNDSSDW